MSSLRLAVLASGRGSNFQALLDATRGLMPEGLTSGGFIPGGGRPPRLEAEIVGLFSDQPGAPVLELARAASIPAQVLRPRKGESRADFGSRLADAVEASSPDLVLLLGWMRLLPSSFLSTFPGRVLNLHPALPGAFPGLRAIERAWAAYREGRVEGTGVMIHFVPDEGVDSGPLLASAPVEIGPHDSLETLEKRVHETEHRLLVETLLRLANNLRSTTQGEATHA